MYHLECYDLRVSVQHLANFVGHFQTSSRPHRPWQMCPVYSITRHLVGMVYEALVCVYSSGCSVADWVQVKCRV